MAEYPVLADLCTFLLLTGKRAQTGATGKRATGRNMYQGRLRQSGKASMELNCANIDHVYI